MSRNKLNLLIDVLAFLAMGGLASTGLMLAYRLPPGSGSLAVLGRTRHEWGDVHFCLALSLLALMVLHVVLHWGWVKNALAAVLAVRTPRKPGAGLGGTLALLILGVVVAAAIAAPWVIAVEERGRGGEGEGHGYRGGRGGQRGSATDCDSCSDASSCAGKAGEATADAEPRGKGGRGKGAGAGQGRSGEDDPLRGRNTLVEAAQAAGVPVSRLLQELKLPADTPLDSRLGPLCQEHGLTMEDFRAAVERLKSATPAP
jgi:hypothetical protein